MKEEQKGLTGLVNKMLEPIFDFIGEVVERHNRDKHYYYHHNGKEIIEHNDNYLGGMLIGYRCWRVKNERNS